MDFSQLITTSNIVLAWKFYNYATTAYTCYHVYSTVRYVYDATSGASKAIYSVYSAKDEKDKVIKDGEVELKQINVKEDGDWIVL